MSTFTKKHAEALFLLAGIEALGFYEMANQYWPETPTYDECRRRSPWWLVKTARGLIVVGWRKRVISIDWTDTGIAAEVTQDDVTKDQHWVHAWSYAKAIEYLAALRAAFAKAEKVATLTPGDAAGSGERV